MSADIAESDVMSATNWGDNEEKTKKMQVGQHGDDL